MHILNKGLKFLGIVTSLGMLIVLLQGALVTQTESGDACGQTWPLCYGEVLPEERTVQTWIEYTHRIVSAIMGIVVIAFSMWAWKAIGHLRETKPLAFLAIFAIILQGFLGAAAVVWGQSDAVMALHFGVSLISLASVVLLAILVFENDRPRSYWSASMNKGTKWLIYGSLIYTYIVVYTGAYVKHTGAGGACMDFPLCNGEWFPVLEGLVGVHFGHRVAAMTLWALILILLIQLYRQHRNHKPLFYSGVLAFLFISIQALSGVLVLFTTFHLAMTMFHALFVSLLFSCLSYTAMIAIRSN
ncbi:heme A synthase [Texcoconibacillus texcoconensis]|uniref:COX15/CtaA family protein n=1 Tax=Texcoconibacillus texcoconensis TaxID=1095777 RepID=UPI0031B58CD4